MGLVLCLPVLLAAAAPPEPKAAAPPPVQHVESVPPDRVIAVLGRMVSAPDGKDLGRLVDVLVDVTGKPEAAVIDFGGFMGVGARKIAVHWSTLHFAPADPKRLITLELTLDQIKAVPEYKGAGRPAPVVEVSPPPAPAASGTATQVQPSPAETAPPAGR